MASCNAVLANALTGSLSPGFIGTANPKLRSATWTYKPAFGGARCAQSKPTHACSSAEDRSNDREAIKERPSQSVQKSLAAAALAGLLTIGQVPIANAGTFDFNTSDEQTLTQDRQGEGSGKANSRDDTARQGPTSGGPRVSSSQGSALGFDFNTSDEQTLTQKRQGEGSGKANSRDDFAREGPNAGVKRASSSQAPSADDFPGRAGRTAAKAKETAENLVPGQPGKALENATRGLRFGKELSNAGVNPVTTLSAAFDFNTSDEQTLTQNRQGEGSGKANSRDDTARQGPTSGGPRLSSSQGSALGFDFNTSDEQTLTQKRQGEGSGKANSRDDFAREGPNAGVKRASSSQAPSADDFPGRAGRTAAKAKETAENLVPGQPGTALENATRGLRFGKELSDAGVNPVTTLSDASADFVNPREGLADARESVQSNRLEARRVSKEGREAIMKDNAEKAATNQPPKTVQELVAQKQKLVGKVDSLQDGMDSAAPGQARGKSFY